MADAKRSIWRVRIGLVVMAIGAWFLTQWLIAGRTPPTAGINDGMHRLTAPLHDWLWDHERAANVLMIASSGFIDGFAIYVLLMGIFGKSFRPFIGLFILFLLRQICEGLVSLPTPEHMIWRYPGCPAILVTYGVATDLFFSGHTSVAVFGALELGRRGRGWLAFGICVAIFEALTVLTLRAHYTMDVFAAAMTALYVSKLAEYLAPYCDRWIARIAGADELEIQN